MLVPLAIVLLGVIVAVFWWAARSGQFDDLEGPAWRILMDEDRTPPRPADDHHEHTEAGEPPRG